MGLQVMAAVKKRRDMNYELSVWYMVHLNMVLNDYSIKPYSVLRCTTLNLIL
jgi:hypothetical protein